MVEAKITFEAINGEGFRAGYEHLSIDEARERCRQQFWGNCVANMKPCDLNQRGRCHQSSPVIISHKANP